MPILTRGLSVPVGVGVNGGAKLNPAATHFDQTLALAFSEGLDDNAFQDLGISSEVIFEINDIAGQASIKRRIRDIASKFLDRIRLDPQRPVEFQKGDEGEIIMNVRYVDLATDEPNEFTTTFGSPGKL